MYAGVAIRETSPVNWIGSLHPPILSGGNPEAGFTVLEGAKYSYDW
jgi:hypothetical protein